MEQRVNWTKNGLVAAVWFGLPMGSLAGLLSSSLPTGLGAGLVAGGLFGLAIALFGKLQSRALATPGGVDEAGESVLFEGPANHFKGIEGVGGKLSLTAARLRFRSHAVNVQNHDESYPIGTIARVEATRTLGIIPNGLLVFRTDGGRERFVVQGRDAWVARIRVAIEAAGPRVSPAAPHNG